VNNTSKGIWKGHVTFQGLTIKTYCKGAALLLSDQQQQKHNVVGPHSSSLVSSGAGCLGFLGGGFAARGFGNPFGAPP
jgi:hypothetical protein